MSIYIIARSSENLVSIASDGRSITREDGNISRIIHRDDARKSFLIVDGVSMCMSGYVNDQFPLVFHTLFSESFSTKGLYGCLRELEQEFSQVVSGETLQKMQREATGTKYADLHVVAYENDDIKFARVRIDRDQGKLYWSEETSKFPFRVGGLSEAAELVILKMALFESPVCEIESLPAIMNYMLQKSEENDETVGGERYISRMTPTDFGDLNDKCYVQIDQLASQVHDIVEKQKYTHLPKKGELAVRMFNDGIRTMHAFHPAAKLAEERLGTFVETQDKEYLQDASTFLYLATHILKEKEESNDWYQKGFIHGVAIPASISAKVLHLRGDRKNALDAYRYAIKAPTLPTMEGHKSKIRALKGIRDLGDRSDRKLAESGLKEFQKITQLTWDSIEDLV